MHDACTRNAELARRSLLRQRPATIRFLLDFGINVIGDRITGDANFDALCGVAGAITPVPGGTGPITALMLARNTIAAGIAGLHGDLDSIPPFERWQVGEVE